ncbi:hypothetical protein [uncultured Jannaschia sp.]|uniref:hypothetical protein n=1 Tax=uncultured Jannaschia sp. TaxID=293347 RepID=UPI00260D0AC5|nr:hypothetical protein [uncultured Jannaschia sp.]
MGKPVEDRVPQEDGSHASGLPYDPEQWERRLERARAERAEVLRRRRDGEVAATDTAPEAAVAASSATGARILRAPAEGRAPQAAKPPIVDSADRPIRPPETPWKLLAFTCLGVSLLCIGIAIGATMAGRWRPLAEDAGAPATITVEAGPMPSAAAAPEVDRPAEAARPAPAIADALADSDVAQRGDPDLRELAGDPTPPAAETSETEAVEPSGPVSEPARTDAPRVEIVLPSEAGRADPTASPGDAKADTDAAEDVLGANDAPPEDTSVLPAALTNGVDLVVHAPRSVNAAAREALSEALRSADFAVNAPLTVNLTISETHLRYYHAADEAAATAIASVLGVPARDFTSFRPSPRDGLVEVWMAGHGTTRRESPREAGPGDLPALISRIRNAIQRNRP